MSSNRDEASVTKARHQSPVKPGKRDRNVIRLLNNKASDTEPSSRRRQPFYCTADRESAALAILFSNPLIIDDGRRLTFTDRDTCCLASDAGNRTARRGDGAGQRSGMCRVRRDTTGHGRLTGRWECMDQAAKKTPGGLTPGDHAGRPGDRWR
ncbi:MAG: hypothetical protein CMJ21_01260 [Phycisphaerae bacterium]|nr:hypothetical protein [Phycisphaerae bacterium]